MIIWTLSLYRNVRNLLWIWVIETFFIIQKSIQNKVSYVHRYLKTDVLNRNLLKICEIEFVDIKSITFFSTKSRSTSFQLSRKLHEMFLSDVRSERSFNCESFIAKLANFIEDSSMKLLVIIQVANIHKLPVTFGALKWWWQVRLHVSLHNTNKGWTYDCGVRFGIKNALKIHMMTHLQNNALQ